MGEAGVFLGEAGFFLGEAGFAFFFAAIFLRSAASHKRPGLPASSSAQNGSCHEPSFFISFIKAIPAFCCFLDTTLPVRLLMVRSPFVRPPAVFLAFPS